MTLPRLVPRRVWAPSPRAHGVRSGALPPLAALVVALVLAVLTLPPLSPVARAQGIVTVDDVEMISRFPQGVQFLATVSAPRDIAEVTLRYRVLGERASRYARAEILASRSVRADFFVRTDTADRYIPPGAEIEYQFEGVDVAGERFQSEPRRTVLLDPRHAWERLDGPAGYVLSYGANGELAARVLATARETIERVGALIGTAAEGPVRLTLYGTWDEMRTALPPRSQVQEATLVTEGVSFGSTGVVLLLGDLPNLEGVTAHETVHFLVQGAMGSRIQLVPDWLNEGLAEYANPEASRGYGRALARAVEDGRLLRLTAMTRRPGRPEDVVLFYGQSESIVGYLVETHGAGPLPGLFEGLRAGAALDEALEAAYGFDRVELERRWRASVGAPPLEGATAPVALPTPVPRPTLVPYGAAPLPAQDAGSAAPAPGDARATQPPAPPAAAGGCTRTPEGTGAALPTDASGVVLALVLVGMVAFRRVDLGRRKARRARGGPPKAQDISQEE